MRHYKLECTAKSFSRLLSYESIYRGLVLGNLPDTMLQHFREQSFFHQQQLSRSLKSLALHSPCAEHQTILLEVAHTLVKPSAHFDYLSKYRFSVCVQQSCRMLSFEPTSLLSAQSQRLYRLSRKALPSEVLAPTMSYFLLNYYLGKRIERDQSYTQKEGYETIIDSWMNLETQSRISKLVVVFNNWTEHQSCAQFQATEKQFDDSNHFYLKFLNEFDPSLTMMSSPKPKFRF